MISVHFTFSYHWHVTFGYSISFSLAYSFSTYVFVSLSVDVSYLRWLYLSIFIAAPVCACIYINLSLFYECFFAFASIFFFKHLITIKYSTMLVELNCVRVSNFLLNCDQSQSSQHENYLIMVLIVELYFTSFFEHIYSFIFYDNWESCQFFTENIFFLSQHHICFVFVFRFRCFTALYSFYLIFAIQFLSHFCDILTHFSIFH